MPANKWPKLILQSFLSCSFWSIQNAGTSLFCSYWASSTLFLGPNTFFFLPDLQNTTIICKGLDPFQTVSLPLIGPVGTASWAQLLPYAWAHIFSINDKLNNDKKEEGIICLNKFLHKYFYKKRKIWKLK